MNHPSDPSQPPAGVPHCYKHPGRETWISCQRCERPICPDCMRVAAVGHQCPDCVKQGAKETRSGLTLYGGRVSRDPRLTSIGLIVVNVGVWLAVVFTGGFSSRLASWLMLTPVGRCVAPDGSGWYPNADSADTCSQVNAVSSAVWEPGFTDGAFWQAVTHGFTHVEITHIAFNCFALWILGPAVEMAVGRARFLSLYFVSVLAGGAVVAWFSGPYDSTLGASGGVFGLMAAMLILVWKVGGDLRQLGALVAVNVAITFLVPNISWQGHLGGFIGGGLAALVIVTAPRGARRSVLQWCGLALLVVVCAAAFLARATWLAPV